MKSPARIFVDAPLAEGGEAPLSQAQAHYLGHVLRLAPGDAVAAFNARDGEWRARIARLGKKDGSIAPVDQLRAAEAGPDLILLFAPVKRAPVDLIAQKATELGVAALQPVETARTVVSRVNVGRLQANAVEAAEQCGRLDVPRVHDPVKLVRLLDGWDPHRRILFCDEAGDDPAEDWGGRAGRARPVLEALAPFAGETSGPWAILTGPEGGFAPDERARLRTLDFVTPATLGPRILRADTAALSAISLWQAALGDFRRA